MLLNKTTVLSVLFAIWYSLSSSRFDPNNPPVGHTGAPGDQTCAKSGCHSGGTYTGSVSITGIPDSVVANQTYPITVTNASNAVRAGFQLTCLNATNAACGTITAASGVSVGTSGAKQYARQSTPKSLSGGTASWTFNWKAPAMLADPKITFYFSSLCANGNGEKTGDNVVLGSAATYLKATSPVSDVENETWYQMNVDQNSKQLEIALQQAGKGNIEVFSINGQSVLNQSLTASESISLIELGRGIYIAHIEAGGKKAAVKFFLAQ